MDYTYAVEEIAKIVYDNLNIPKDIYKTFDLETASEFKSYYLSDTSYLRSMIADELYERGIEVEPARQSDLIEDIEFEVSDLIEENLEQYSKYQHNATMFEYETILQALRDYAASPVSSITDIQEEHYYEYGEDPTITITILTPIVFIITT